MFKSHRGQRGRPRGPPPPPPTFSLNHFGCAFNFGQGMIRLRLKNCAYNIRGNGSRFDQPAPNPSYKHKSFSYIACVAGARLNRARVIQTGARERSQSREEKWRELSLACVYSYSRSRQAPATLFQAISYIACRLWNNPPTHVRRLAILRTLLGSLRNLSSARTSFVLTSALIRASLSQYPVFHNFFYPSPLSTFSFTFSNFSIVVDTRTFF